MIKKLADNLSISGIRYCILHGWQSLAENLCSDVDIVVLPEDLSALEGILRNHSGGGLVQLLQHESSCFYFVLTGGQGRHGFALLDAATDYRRDGYIFLSAEDLLARRRQWNGLWVAAPDVEFAYLLIKKVSKGMLPDHQKARLRQLETALGEEAEPIARRLFGLKYGTQLKRWIAGSDWASFEAHLSAVKHALHWQVVKRDPFNPIRYGLREVKRIWHRWRYPTGFLVAVLGPDGAGKSTLVGHLSEKLVAVFRRTEIFHLRPSVIGRQKSHGPVTDPHREAPHRWWLSLVKIAYYLLDYGLGYLFKVRPRLVRSTLVLFDRYYDDLLVDQRRYRYGGPLWFARVAHRFIPNPDLVIILDVPEEQLLARKQEVCLKELRRQREGYRKVAVELSNAVFLDGSLGPEEVTQNASEAILDYLRARYLNRRHFWFRDNGMETLNWLESVLFSSGKSRLALSNLRGSDYRRQWRANDSFGWLALDDGRGYLIPLGSGQVGINALRLYNAQNVKARIVKKLFAVGLRGGFAHPFLRKVQGLIREDVAKNERGMVSLFEHLKEVFERRHLSFAISLGTPGPHRKPVIQVLTNEGEVLGYVKVGWNEATNALVEHEARVLQYMARTPLTSFTVPRILHSGWWNGRFLLIQSAPEGEIEPAPRDMTPKYLSVLKELASLHTCSIPLKESAFWTNLMERIENAPKAYYHHVLRQGASEVENWLGDTTLPFHFRHGDFAPWNAQLLNGRLFLFDWEYADLEAPPGWDLFHFSVQTLRLLGKRTADEIYKTVLNGDTEKQGVSTYLESVNMKESSVRSLFLFYVLERLAFYASERDADHRTLRYFSNIANRIMFEKKFGQ